MKKTFKIIGWTILTPVLLVALYLSAAYLLSRIAVAKEDTARADIPLYILTNGVHTDLVMPVRNQQIDWSKEVLFENTSGKDTSAQWIAFGWGDKGFYLETPTWADLKFSTAFKAATGLSTSAIHATYYRGIRESKDCIRLNVDSAQYARLISYIRESFDRDANGNIIHIVTNANYGKTDAFYEAKGSYSLFHTCNTWANSGLKHCGQKACLWTPFDKGIFYQYR
ncbi:TIGR02117 family protein [Chitinophaga filiformis]|uniref:TIGR02117 family protein n=1 Tax=Chitinophaga filiformis TaxID=104663 RepID=A0ABY4I300_CHIFI|nr:TIGR02117 family protein [Chitinophaga filiformis]UPK69121.1 TIGR02117 family protein [Chitinophaga filiformis]